MEVRIKPYGQPKQPPTVPALVQLFIDGKFSQECAGFATKVTTDSHDTGHGMDYLNRLTVTQGESVVYDSGMLKWRNGLPGGYDSPENRIRKVGLKLDGETLLLGIENGNEVVLIYELKAGQHQYREECNIGAVRKAKQSAEITLTDLAALKTHFNVNNNRDWTIGSNEFDCDLGRGVLAYHNGHPTDNVWDYFVILIIHDGKPFISDRIPTGLTWHEKFTDCGVLNRKIASNHFDVTFWCAYHEDHGDNPNTVSFDLVLNQ